jgi:hypothetical protein
MRHPVGVADCSLFQCGAGRGGKRQHQQASGLAFEIGGYQGSVTGKVESIDGQQALGKGGSRQGRWLADGSGIELLAAAIGRAPEPLRAGACAPHAFLDFGGLGIVRQRPPPGNAPVLGQGIGRREQCHRAGIGAMPAFVVIDQCKGQVGLMPGNGCHQNTGGGCCVEFGGRKVRESCQAFAFRPDGIAGVIERALPIEAAPAGRSAGQQLQFPVPAVDAECATGVGFDDLLDAPVRIESTPRVVV